MEVLETLSHLPTKAIVLTKKAFNHSYENDLKEQLDLEGIYQQDAENPRFQRRSYCILEKENPNYTGKYPMM